MWSIVTLIEGRLQFQPFKRLGHSIQFMASLFLALDRVGEKVGRERLQKAKEILHGSMDHEFEDGFL